MMGICDLHHKSLSIPGLEIGTGDTYLIGPNGSGKTTLLRILAGIDVPESGTVTFDGSPPRDLNIGWVNEYPGRSLLFSRVYDEIASSFMFTSVPCAETRTRVVAIADTIGIRHLLERQVNELSGGEKVLIATAAALAGHPSVVILDEYDSHLDFGWCRRIDAAIQSVHPRYTIRCTQQMDTAATGDFLVMLDGGHVSHAGLPSDVFTLLEDTPYYPRLWRGSA